LKSRVPNKNTVARRKSNILRPLQNILGWLYAIEAEDSCCHENKM